MDMLKSWKISDVHYIDIPYKMQIHYFQKSEIGKRVSVRKNSQTNTIEIKAIKGDWRYPDRVEYEVVAMDNSDMNIDDESIMKIVYELAEKHF